MGASVSPRGGKKRRLNAEMNVVPYIDVMLVLLIIFMVTAPLLTQGIDVELPEADAANITQGEEPITLSVSRDGQLFLNVGENRSAALSDDEVVQQAGWGHPGLLCDLPERRATPPLAGQQTLGLGDDALPPVLTLGTQRRIRQLIGHDRSFATTD